jgi:FixJ family two-component response regulator
MNLAATTAISIGSTPCPIPALSRNWDLRVTSSTGPNVYVLDDDNHTQRSLEELIYAQGWEPRTCDSAQELFAQSLPIVPSCLILALSSANSNSLETQKRIARKYAEIPIIVVAAYKDIPTTVQAMKAGAVDFLVKPFSDEQLLAAIRDGLARSLAALDRWREMSDLRNCYASLSRREQQVMALVGSGLLNKQVGGELGISEITVKAHRGQVMQKMKASSFAHLVNMASKLRITSSATSNVAYA